MKIELTIDPYQRYTQASLEQVLEICGLLPYWVTDPDLFHLPLKEALTKSYGFGELSEMQGFVECDGVLRYPEDPTMWPLLRINRGDEVFWQYEYGIVLLVDSNGNNFITRMD
jgi:hypothetical protein